MISLWHQFRLRSICFTLKLLFSMLNRLNITLEPEKSYIGYPSVQLLGLRVNNFRQVDA